MGDMRMQPNPSLETIGPFCPKAIFVTVVIVVILSVKNTKIEAYTPLQVSLTAQLACLNGSR